MTSTIAGSSTSTEISHRTIEVNGVSLHVAEAGSGPLVLLLHGFPECWYSWRHQLTALAAAGYHAVAPDQRGYGRSTCPTEIDKFTLLHTAGDAVALIEALGAEKAVVIGHDFGSPVAWTTALMRPDLVRGVVGMSVPPDGPLLPLSRPDVAPIEGFRRTLGDNFYMVSFQEPGVAESLFGDDMRANLLGMIVGANSEEGRDADFDDDSRPAERGFATLPKWLSEVELETMAAEYQGHKFTGGLNWYRNIDRNYELLAAYAGAEILPPALFLVGDRDNVSAFLPMPGSLDELREVAPAARDLVTVPDCGHWTQQEQPEFVTKAILDFVASLD